MLLKESVTIEQESLAGLGLKYNPCVVRFEGEMWMAYRARLSPAAHRHESCIGLARLSPQYQVLESRLLTIPAAAGAVSQEDPRLFVAMDTLWLSFAEPSEAWRRCRVVVGRLIPRRFRWVAEVPLTYARSTPREKNWLLYDDGDGMKCLYRPSPHTLLDASERNMRLVLERPGPTWAFGEWRNSAGPVLRGDEWYVITHSYEGTFQQWSGRRYHVGAYTYDAKPPYRIKRFTPAPISSAADLAGPFQDHPRVLLPMGLVWADDRWIVSCGVNDAECRILHLDADQLERNLVPWSE
ncbi:MAG TPA: hypothetical protein VFB66_08720 [Tepidisphaeraceae bacterium]|nr:hypothetical protein [Tepidisphaeraceae bacterium]